MKESIAKKLAEIAEEFGNEIEIRTDYSGRSMYRETTTGIVVNDETHFYLAVAQLCYDLGNNHEDENNLNFEDVLDTLSRLRKDNMGLGIIIY